MVAVKKREWSGGAHNELPDPDRPLKAGDRLIVVGHVDDLDRLLAAASSGAPQSRSRS